MHTVEGAGHELPPQRLRTLRIGLAVAQEVGDELLVSEVVKGTGHGGRVAAATAILTDGGTDLPSGLHERAQGGLPVADQRTAVHKQQAVEVFVQEAAKRFAQTPGDGLGIVHHVLQDDQ